MQIQPVEVHPPIGHAIRRWMLYGGAFSAEAMLLALAASGWYPFEVVSIAALSVGGMFAAVAFGIGYFLQRRGSSLSRIRRDLEQASEMRERGLIDQDDYLRLKAQTLEHFRPGAVTVQRLWPAVFWAGMIGMALPLFGFAASWTAIPVPLAVLVGGAAFGGAAAGSAGLAVEIIRRRLSRPQLPAPESHWRRLGE